jgi:soluble lytic murein transglycosylase-like protein
MKFNLLVFLSIIFLISFKPITIQKINEDQKLTQKEFYQKITGKPEIIEIIYDVNEYYNIDIELLIALSRTESGLNPTATNEKKNKNGSIDRGLYQLNSNYFKSPDIYNELVNITLGITFFNNCLKRANGDIEKALMLYNSGQQMKKYENFHKYYCDIQIYRFYLKSEFENR